MGTPAPFTYRQVKELLLGSRSLVVNVLKETRTARRSGESAEAIWLTDSFHKKKIWLTEVRACPSVVLAGAHAPRPLVARHGLQEREAATGAWRPPPRHARTCLPYRSAAMRLPCS